MKHFATLIVALIVAATMTVVTAATISADSPTSKHYVLLTDNQGQELCIAITYGGGGGLSFKLAERSKCDPPPEPPPEPECQLIQGEAGQPGEVELQVEVIVDGLEIPWGLAILPSGDMLVTERPGRVRLIQDGEIVPESVLEFGVSILPPLGGHPIAGSEGGLLGILLHPEFADNRQFYLFYNIDNEDGVQIGQIGALRALRRRPLGDV